MTSPAFQFYVKQWLGDSNVMLMDWDARGMHLHFMCIAWQMHDPCKLPDDDVVLQKWVGNPEDWSTRLKEQIFRAWRLENGVWIQDGLLREFVKQQRFSESRKKNAEARWGKKKPNASAKQVHSRATCKCNALQSSSSSSTTDILTPISPLRFDEFWNLYPNHTAKKKALESWLKLKPENGTIDLIIGGLKKQIVWRESQKGKKVFIPEWPHPATWLNQERWNDEPSTTNDQSVVSDDDLKELF